MKPQRPSDYPWPVTAHHASFIEDFNNAMDSRPITPTTASDSAVSTPTATPTVAEAIEYARNLPADCHADRCIIVPATELARLRAEVERLKELLRIESASAQHALAAAERAEAELSDERARLDWLLDRSAQTHHSYSNPLGGGNYVQYHKDRAAIDAAMKP